MKSTLSALCMGVAASIALTVRAATPVNDNFIDAIELSGNSGSLSGNNNIDATFETGEQDCVYGDVTSTVWFKWVCESVGTLTLSSLGSRDTTGGEWDVCLGVYSGPTLTGLTKLAEQDTGYEEEMSLNVSSGTTYYIQMGGFGNAVATNILLTWSYVPLATVDVGGYITNPKSEIGSLNTANMTNNTTFGWQTGGCAIPVINNGFLFSLDSGGGNYFNYTGDISGTGGLSIAAGGIGILHIGGSVGNTYSGVTTVNSGPVSLEKSSGNALCGAITVQGAPSDNFPNMGNVVWTAADQISDASDVTLTASTFLNLAGFSDTINELHLVTGSHVQTAVGGVLKVAKLFLNGEQQPDVAYIAGDGYIFGTGYIEVGASGPPVITDPPAEPVNPVPATASTTVHPAFLTKLDWDDSARAVSYDVYLWPASAPDLIPGIDAPTANVSLSDYSIPADLNSLTEYKWQVVAKNGFGDFNGAVWTFTTVDRRDISSTLTPGPHGPAEGMLIDATVGIGNTGRLVGSTQTYWGSGGFSVDLNLNGNMLIVDTGHGNHMDASGSVFGNGDVRWQGPVLHITGSVGNSYTGTTYVSSAVSLGKSSGNALCGTITADTGATLTWAGPDQIEDTSVVTLVTTGTLLNLAGYSEKFASLTLETGTSVETGSGGVLTVTSLTLGATTYTLGMFDNTSSPDFITGTGYIQVVEKIKPGTVISLQ